MRIYPRHGVLLSSGVSEEVLKQAFRNARYGMDEVSFFEERFASYIGTTYALAGSSARALLNLSLKAMGIGSGSQVIMPAYTFSALPFMIKAAGAEPVFVDVCENTRNIDPQLIEARITKKTRALLVTHMFGQPCDMGQILDICRKHGIILIEDCAHACGAEYYGAKTGSFGDFAIFSFKMGKNMPCFGGGSIATNNKTLYKEVKKATMSYSLPQACILLKEIVTTYLFYLATRRWIFPFAVYPPLLLLERFQPGFMDRFMGEDINIVSAVSSLKNQARFTGLQARVGLRQIENIGNSIARTRRNSLLLSDNLKDVAGISVPFVIPGAKTTFLFYGVKVERANAFRRAMFLRGIDTKADDMSFCAGMPDFRDGSLAEFPVASSLPGRTVILPNGPSLRDDDMVYIADTAKDIIKWQR